MSPAAGATPDLAALSPWAPELAQTFVSLASDIALVIDASGVIRNVAQGSSTPLSAAAFDWVGRAWVDTVTGDTRSKIERLLEEVSSTGIARKREVNHPSGIGDSIPVAYTAIRLGQNGPVLAAGRDLRAIAAIQQRFVEAQRELERGYWGARQAESRYRLLFQVATDAVMIVDAESLKVMEANQAASQMFDMRIEHLQGRELSSGFERSSRGAVEQLLTTARAGGRAGEIRARLVGKVAATSVAATPFRSEQAMRLLVRVRADDRPANTPDWSRTLVQLVDGARDAVVVTDSSGRVLAANPAFVELVGRDSEVELKGRLLGDETGLSRTDIDGVLMAVRREGLARGVASSVRAVGGTAVPVEISAALLTEGDQECVGFTLHCLARPAEGRGAEALQSLLEQLASRLGSIALPALLQEASAQVEQFLIQSALERAGSDADAARLLGISPQTLRRRSPRPGQRSGPAAGD